MRPGIRWFVRSVALVGALVTAVVVAAPAQADVVGCRLDGRVLRVDVEGAFNVLWVDDGTIMVGYPGAADNVRCAALPDVRRVEVTGTDGDDDVIVGADPADDARLLSVPLRVDLGEGDDGFGIASGADQVRVRATGPDRIRTRVGDDRTVVRLAGVEIVAVSGSPLDDRIVLRRLAVSTAQIFGGDGDDRLVGTRVDDLIVGGAGADRIRCGPGEDTTDDPPDPLDVLRGCED